MLNSLHPAEIPPNSTFTYEIPSHGTDLSVHAPSNVEAPLMTTSVASQPNTVNQPPSALQQIHNYINTQLTNLVEVAVEQVVGLGTTN